MLFDGRYCEECEKAEQEPCDTCKHNAEEWDGEHCDSCCGNHSGYEPCEDAVSRKAVLDLLAYKVPYPYYENVFNAVDELPSVQPTMKADDFAKRFVEYLKKENR